MPALLSFGPLLMVIGLQGAGNHWVALIGALMVSFGSLCLFVTQQRLVQKLEQAEE